MLVDCLVTVGPELDAGEEFLSEPTRGLEFPADEAPEPDVLTGVSEPDWPSLLSAGAEPLLEDAGDEVGLRGVGGGGLEGRGGLRGRVPPADTDGELLLGAGLRLLGEERCSMLSTAGELSLLRLRA